MRVKVKNNDDGTLRLSITATAKEVDEAFDKAEAAVASRFGLKPDPRILLLALRQWIFRRLTDLREL